MYIRYIKKLYDLHLSAHNYVEAGLTLQLYAQILQWRDCLRKDELDYPQQPEWERKERVYVQVIECFDRGKVSVLLYINWIKLSLKNTYNFRLYILKTFMTVHREFFTSGNFGENDAWKLCQIFTESYFRHFKDN